MSPYLTLSLVLGLCSQWIVTINAFPRGAPSSVCESMTPGHGTVQTSTAPYTLSVDVTTYEPGLSVRVTVTGTAYKGILLQARRKGSPNLQPVGTFSTPSAGSNLRLLGCNGVAESTITHSSTTTKQNSVLTWNPPGTNGGELEFVATIASEKFIWWQNVKSPSLTFRTTTVATTTPPLPTTITTTTTTPVPTSTTTVPGATTLTTTTQGTPGTLPLSTTTITLPATPGSIPTPTTPATPGSIPTPTTPATVPGNSSIPTPLTTTFVPTAAATTTTTTTTAPEASTLPPVMTTFVPTAATTITVPTTTTGSSTTVNTSQNSLMSPMAIGAVTGYISLSILKIVFFMARCY